MGLTQQEAIDTWLQTTKGELIDVLPWNQDKMTKGEKDIIYQQLQKYRVDRVFHFHAGSIIEELLGNQETIDYVCMIPQNWANIIQPPNANAIRGLNAKSAFYQPLKDNTIMCHEKELYNIPGWTITK